MDEIPHAFDHFFRSPKSGEVYNMGGGRISHCSMQEAVHYCQDIAQQALDYTYNDENRIGDHIWWISNLNKFRSHYPDWQIRYDIKQICDEIYQCNAERWLTQSAK